MPSKNWYITTTSSGPMIRVAIHSVPRSGSSWLGAIFDSSPKVAYRFQPLFSYAFKARLDEHSTADQVRIFYEDILKTDDQFVLQRDNSKGEDIKMPGGVSARFVDNMRQRPSISHVVYKEVRYHHIVKNLLEVDPEIRVIGLVRNPLGVINSFLKNPREFRADLGWIAEEEWRHAQKKNRGRIEEYNGFEKWIEATKLFLELEREYSDRFMLVRYADLLEDTVGQVKAIFAFCNLPFDVSVSKFISDSRSRNEGDGYSTYKVRNMDDTWKKELPDAIVNSILVDLRKYELGTFLD